MINRKNIKIAFVTILIFLLCFFVTPAVHAEEIENIESETNNEILENEENEKVVVYTYEDEKAIYVFTLLDDVNCKIEATSKNEKVTLETTYVLVNDQLEITINEEVSIFTINEDNTLNLIEEETPSEDDEFITSELGKFFSDEITAKIIEAVILMIAFLTTTFITILKNKGYFKNIKVGLDDNLTNVAGSVNKVEASITQKLFTLSSTTSNLKNEVIEIKKLFSEEVKVLRNELSKEKSKNEKLKEENSQIQNILRNMDSIKKAFGIIICNNPDLVANGQAKTIAKELGLNGEQESL